MKITRCIIVAASLSALSPTSRLSATPVGTAFTYQGLIQKNGVGVNGACSIRFTLYDAVTGGATVGAPNPNTVAVSAVNGVFSTTLDFGANAFNGDNARWLQIEVKGPSDVGYTTLTPRQPVSPTPYAIFALSTLPTSGSWSLTGNAGTNGTNFLGTTDAQPLELHVKGLRASRLEFAGGTFRNSINVLNGLGTNTLTGSPMGATISGGGLYDGISMGGSLPNNVGADFGTVAGGAGNSVSGPYGTVAGGLGNSANGFGSFAAGQSATAAHFGSFVWGDGSGPVTSTANYSFDVRAMGGAFFHGPWIVATGLGNEQAYLGGDGSGGDVQLGSTSPVVSTIACYNTATGNYMDMYVRTLTITGGADLAEPFTITDRALPPGSVVVIDDEHPGRLRLSDQAYDTRVAGVISGAGGIHPGVSMHPQRLSGSGQEVALTGRAYVLADASTGPIRPGDLLTTSPTPGHAMKVSDAARASGAILGKAMSGLSQGRGLVLVLVSLQ